MSLKIVNVKRRMVKEHADDEQIMAGIQFARSYGAYVMVATDKVRDRARTLAHENGGSAEHCHWVNDRVMSVTDYVSGCTRIPHGEPVTVVDVQAVLEMLLQRNVDLVTASAYLAGVIQP